MSIMSVILLIVTFVIFVIGIVGIVMPAIPSLPVIWMGILLYAIFTNFDQVTWIAVVITGIFMVIGTVADALAGVFGAKAYGASWYGVVGAVIGGVFGIFVLNIFGLFLGSFIGAFVGEFIRYKRAHHAVKAGIGTIIGFIFGIAIKIFVSFLMIGIFISALFF